MSTGSNHNISDNDLVIGCISKNRKMQEILYNKYAAKMYSVCLRYSNNAEDAQDLLQEGFVKLFNNIEKYRGDGSFEGWVRRIFVNTSIEYYRRKTKINLVPETNDNTVEDKEWNALDSFAEKDIIKLIQELSPGYRQVFCLYAIEGYSHKEIGDMMGISEGTSKSQLARAKTILKKLVEERLSL